MAIANDIGYAEVFRFQLRGNLEPGDILIDGGNSRFQDTARRCAGMARHGLRYIGMGVSGGEEGAEGERIRGGTGRYFPMHVQSLLFG